MRDYYRRNAQVIRERVRRYQKANGDKVRAIDRKRGNRRSKEQNRATNAVKHELKMGRLKRPLICSECKTSPPPAVDGRAQIEAHHEDYSKPLEVVWLCKMCHMGRHRQVAA